MDKKQIIGGDFEIESSLEDFSIQSQRLVKYQHGAWTLSGRSALSIIIDKLKRRGVNHIHLPAFLCKSILQVVKESGINYSFYAVNLDLKALPDPPPKSATLLIHYFGFLNDSTKYLRQSDVLNGNLIEDASHIFLSNSYYNEDNIQFVFFSARKFSPIFLGGWCNVDNNLAKATIEVQISLLQSYIARSLKGIYLNSKQPNLITSIEKNYLDLFKKSEAIFNSPLEPTALPDLAMSLIKKNQWDDLIKKRRRNWMHLNELIGDKFDLINDTLSDDSIPLGYIIRYNKRDLLRNKLAENRIFAPIHWEVPDEITQSKFPDSSTLSNSILTIPIDQRYGPNEMNYIAETILKII